MNGIVKMLLVFVVMLVPIALSGCTADLGRAGDDPPLRIAVSSKGSYDYRYMDYIEAAFPDMKVELIELEPDIKVVVTPEEFERKLLEAEPDLVLTENWHYERLASKGLFEDLALRMKDSGMKEESFYPGMLEWMKQAGGGSLYGLAPTFQASVLYYNPDLFAKYGIAQPHPGMTLEEVYRLGARFPAEGSGEDGIVGLHQSFLNMPYDTLTQFAEEEGLRAVNFTSGKVTVDTPAWLMMMQTIVNLYVNDALSMEEIKPKLIDGIAHYDAEASRAADLFGYGKAAMTIASYGAYPSSKFKAVLPPVSAADRQRTAGIAVVQMMAIRAGSPNADRAWDVIRFMMSDHVAKARTALNDEDGFAAQQIYADYTSDTLIDGLYGLMPNYMPATDSTGYDIRTFYKSFAELVNREIGAAVNGDKPVEAAAAAIQKEGQQLLDTAKR